MQDDMIKAYGDDFAEIIKDEKIEKDLAKALEYAGKNNVSVPKNIHIERFIKRCEAIKATLKARKEEASKGSDNSKALAEIEAIKIELQEKSDELGHNQLELQEERKAFEAEKAEFAVLQDEFEVKVLELEWPVEKTIIDEVEKTNTDEVVEEKKETKKNK